MLKRAFLSSALIAIALTACSGGSEDIALLTTTTTPPTKSVVVLQANGLEVADQELTFDSPQSDAQSAATKALGKPNLSSATCPEGGYDYTEAQYQSVTLLFSYGKFAGWRTDSEAYDTPEGAHIGSTTDFMLDAYEDFKIDNESSIDNEWFAGGYQGTLHENGEEVASLSAGLICIVR